MSSISMDVLFEVVMLHETQLFNFKARKKSFYFTQLKIFALIFSHTVDCTTEFSIIFFKHPERKIKQNAAKV